MFSKFISIQSFIYLFISPLLQQIFFNSGDKYNYIISSFFMISLIIGFLINKSKEEFNKNFFLKIRLNKTILYLWIALVLYITIEENLYITRIGSEVAAYNRSQLNMFSLIVHRVFTLISPILVSLIILEMFDKNASKIIKLLNIFTIGIIIFCMGGFDSRAIAIILLLYAAFFNYGIINIKEWNKLFIKILTVGAIFFLTVMIYRVYGDDNQKINEYFSSELFQRSNGIEFISKFQNSKDTGYFEMHFNGMSNAIKSQLFFLDEAKELKSEGKTSVKTYILNDELGLSNIDVNYSIVADSFYLFGLFGVSIAGILIGFSCKKIDKNGFINKNGKLNISLVSLSISIFSLETDFLSLITTYLKLYLILNILIFVNFIVYKKQND